jgi:hypothetical protein
MGWASAGSIFDPVARALIGLGASGQVMRDVLGPLIDALQENGWDTEDESLDAFADDQVIVALFRERGITTDEEDDDEPMLGG